MNSRFKVCPVGCNRKVGEIRKNNKIVATHKLLLPLCMTFRRKLVLIKVDDSLYVVNAALIPYGV